MTLCMFFFFIPLIHAAVLNTHMHHIPWKADLPMYSGFSEVPEEFPEPDLMDVALLYRKQCFFDLLTDPTCPSYEKVNACLYWEKIECESPTLVYLEAGGLFRDWDFSMRTKK